MVASIIAKIQAVVTIIPTYWYHQPPNLQVQETTPIQVNRVCGAVRSHILSGGHQDVFPDDVIGGSSIIRRRKINAL